MPPISRRTFAAFLATAALTPVLGGCSSSAGSSAEGEGTATTDAGASNADAAASAATRTVDTDKGPVEIPTNPQTIVSDYYLGEFLAVDVKPVVASPYALNNPFLAGLCDDIEALMTLCEADITSGIDAKVKRYMANFELVRRKMKDLEERDRIRNFQPPVTGELIMQTYGIGPCRLIGEIKEVIKNAILDGEIPNDYEAARAVMERLAAEKGLKAR